MRDLLARSDPLTAKYVVKGLGCQPPSRGVSERGRRQRRGEHLAHGRRDVPRGDVGALATLAREGHLAEASLAIFHPIKFMLASPAEDAAEILRRLGPEVWVEDKYDGIRAQLHKIGREVRLYSRDLHDVSGQFPEVVSAAAELPWDGILDGEILAYRAGAVLPFIALQARLGRKSPSAAILEEIPVIYVAFDVLGLDTDSDGRLEALLRDPLTERRRQLDALDLPPADEGGGFARSHLIRVDSIDGLEDAFAAARARRNEGLMVKDPQSGYSPGRRGLGWLKMKKALATIDCVVSSRGARAAGLLSRARCVQSAGQRDAPRRARRAARPP
jgi:DNA ligase-1